LALDIVGTKAHIAANALTIARFANQAFTALAKIALTTAFATLILFQGYGTSILGRLGALQRAQDSIVATIFIVSTDFNDLGSQFTFNVISHHFVERKIAKFKVFKVNTVLIVREDRVRFILDTPIVLTIVKGRLISFQDFRNRNLCTIGLGSRDPCSGWMTSVVRFTSSLSPTR